MARFVDTPTERSLINKYVDSYMAGTSYYAKYIDSTPSFVTYYSRDLDKSMENPGLGQVKEVVGYESPNRYNRIENFPIYGVDEVNPNIQDDGISGISTEADVVGVIIPDTVVPNVDDLVLFSYHESHSRTKALYRITSVDVSSIDSNAYYQVTMSLTSYDLDVLNSRQLVDEYNIVYSNIGTEERTLLLQSDFIRAQQLENLYLKLSKTYIDRFYDDRLGLFLYHDREYMRYIYSDDANMFIRFHDLFVHSKTFLQNIKLDSLPESSDPLLNDYRLPQYEALRAKYEGYDNSTWGEQLLSSTYRDRILWSFSFCPLRKERFALFPERYFRLGHIDLLDPTNLPHRFTDDFEKNTANLTYDQLVLFDVEAIYKRLASVLGLENGITLPTVPFDPDDLSADLTTPQAVLSYILKELVPARYLSYKAGKLGDYDEVTADLQTQDDEFGINSYGLVNDFISATNYLCQIYCKAEDRLMDELDKLMKIIENSIRRPSIYEYVYLPILLYILTQAIDILVNKRTKPSLATPEKP